VAGERGFVKIFQLKFDWNFFFENTKRKIFGTFHLFWMKNSIGGKKILRRLGSFLKSMELMGLFLQTI
jgi:hypothetical protein